LAGGGAFWPTGVGAGLAATVCIVVAGVAPEETGGLGPGGVTAVPVAGGALAAGAPLPAGGLEAGGDPAGGPVVEAPPQRGWNGYVPPLGLEDMPLATELPGFWKIYSKPSVVWQVAPAPTAMLAIAMSGRALKAVVSLAPPVTVIGAQFMYISGPPLKTENQVQANVALPLGMLAGRV